MKHTQDVPAPAAPAAAAVHAGRNSRSPRGTPVPMSKEARERFNLRLQMHRDLVSRSAEGRRLSLRSRVWCTAMDEDFFL